MASTETRKSTLADWVVIALSPALVMGLVGSLAFFLVEVFYGGAYGPELRWQLFFFVFGAVLCARMSLAGDLAARAPLYAGVLGVLVWIGTMRYVTYPPGSPAEPLCGLINAGLVGLIYWSAHKVTRDCTDVGGAEEVSGDGLLQAAGLEALDPRPIEPDAPAAEPGPGGKPAKKRTPGVWVVYFSLAALPLFGLGQALIPAENEATRERAFWLLVVYTGCGLGLLLTTCFLSLRQYLRQRKLRMPAAMTATWLAVGGGLVAALLLLAALIPRPWAETGPFRYQAGSEERDASNYAQRGQSPGAGEGKGGADGKDEAEGHDGRGARGQEQDGQQGQGRGGPDGKGAGGKEGKDGKGGDKDKDARAQNKEGKEGRQGGQRNGQKGKAGNANSPTPPGGSALGDLAARIGPVLKWIVFGVLALVVLIFLLRGGLRYLAQFSQWARNLLDALRNFWARLFAGRSSPGRASADGDGAEEADQGRPFADFPDPFTDGSARRRSPAALIRYAFAALEAWAGERDLARQLDETPTEFARRLGDEIPAIDADARALAVLFARAAYAPGTLPPAAVEPLRGLWQRLDAAAAAPLSG